MERTRQAFLDATDAAIGLVSSDALAERWDQPSALAHWSVRGLAGHLVRNTAGVEQYLDADPDPQGRAISQAAYYVFVMDNNDLNSEFHQGIRGRGEDMAAKGLDELRSFQRATAERLRKRLTEEPPERRVQVFGDVVMLLDDYLVTRLVELSCHIDDLAVSLELPTPEMPSPVLDTAIRGLVATARHRHGDLAVLRALARRERDDVEALRVF